MHNEVGSTLSRSRNSHIDAPQSCLGRRAVSGNQDDINRPLDDNLRYTVIGMPNSSLFYTNNKQRTVFA